jgi:hypothetical protein
LPQGNGSRSAPLAEIEGYRMTFGPPPDDPYPRYCQRLALQGRDPSLPIEREAEPKNVHSIEAARTRRAAAQMMRGRWPAQPAS